MTANGTPADRAPSGGSTSRSLLAEAQRADPAAWERLVTLYAPLVAACCRRWGVAEQDVVDVLQDVFSAVAGHLDRFRKERPADTFRGWLLTIARRELARTVVANGWGLLELRPMRMSLEEIFLSLTTEDAGQDAGQGAAQPEGQEAVNA